MQARKQAQAPCIRVAAPLDYRHILISVLELSGQRGTVGSLAEKRWLVLCGWHLRGIAGDAPKWQGDSFRRLMVGQRDLAPHPPNVVCQSLRGSVAFCSSWFQETVTHDTHGLGFRSTKPTGWSAAVNHAVRLSRMTLQATMKMISSRGYIIQSTDTLLIRFVSLFAIPLCHLPQHSELQSFEHNHNSHIPFSARQYSRHHSQSFLGVTQHQHCHAVAPPNQHSLSSQPISACRTNMDTATLATAMSQSTRADDIEIAKTVATSAAGDTTTDDTDITALTTAIVATPSTGDTRSAIVSTSCPFMIDASDGLALSFRRAY